MWSCTWVAANTATVSPFTVVVNGANAWVSSAPMPITGKPESAMAVRESCRPTGP